MKATEAAALLTMAAAYDNRKPDADQARAWAMALDDLNFHDCQLAVVAHYRKSRDWMMPIDVIAGVKRIRDKRVLDFGPIPDPPSGLDDAAYSRWFAETTRAIADGTYAAPETPALAKRDMRELGQAGTTADAALALRNVREAHERARRDLQAAETKRRQDEQQRRTELDAMRATDPRPEDDPVPAPAPTDSDPTPEEATA